MERRSVIKIEKEVATRIQLLESIINNHHSITERDKSRLQGLQEALEIIRAGAATKEPVVNVKLKPVETQTG